MSLGLLTEKDDAVVWRGPKKQSTIDQLVNDVNWGELDVLGAVHVLYNRSPLFGSTMKNSIGQFSIFSFGRTGNGVDFE